MNTTKKAKYIYKYIEFRQNTENMRIRKNKMDQTIKS
jgi:hypothetical protein